MPLPWLKSKANSMGTNTVLARTWGSSFTWYSTSNQGQWHSSVRKQTDADTCIMTADLHLATSSQSEQAGNLPHNPRCSIADFRAVMESSAT
ncbi:hypothetical protein IF2G_08637 [Cordyceps javanica]|nr:hypothetical protein IF2G_08637 [Cordyceps javanica]